MSEDHKAAGRFGPAVPFFHVTLEEKGVTVTYICSICGYVYDEEAAGIPFAALPEDWTCPRCGAEKAMFDPDGKEEAPAKAEAGGQVQTPVQLSPRALSAIFSNLARGAQKQYHPQEEALFMEISDYFLSLSPAEECNAGDLHSLVSSDLAGIYQECEEAAVKAADRGALRARLWSQKVSRIVESVLSRYEREGGRLLEGKNVYVCSVCGFVFTGMQAPEICPVCKVPAWKFDMIS